MDRNHVVWVHENHGLEVFEEFAKSLTDEQRNEIVLAGGDGARWIDAVVTKYFPNAARCVDPFHVVGWVNTALDEVRMEAVRQANTVYKETEKKFLENIEISSEALEKAERDLTEAQNSGDEERVISLTRYIKILKSFKDLEKPNKRKNVTKLLSILSDEEKATLKRLKALAKELKNSRYAVGKNPENRTENQEDKLKLIATNSPEYYRAYLMKEEIRQILHMDKVNGAADEIDRWILNAKNSKLPAFVALSEKIARHKANILNAIKYKGNSAKSESCNALIKSIIRVGKGFRNLANLKAMIYLKCSRLVVPLNNRFQKTREELEEIRNRAREYRRRRENQRRQSREASAAADAPA